MDIGKGLGLSPSGTKNKKYLPIKKIPCPSQIPNMSEAWWFLSFIDDRSRVTWIFLLKNKSDVSSVFPIFHKMESNNLGSKLKLLDLIIESNSLIK